jgi:hypothetical protein
MASMSGKRHDVDRQAIDHGASLSARTTMGLLDHRHVFSGLGLPVLHEGRVDGFVELPRRIVGNVEQGGGGDRRARREERENVSGRRSKGASKCRRSCGLPSLKSSNLIFPIEFV